MQQEFYKLLKRKGYRIENVGAAAIQFEAAHLEYNKNLVPLVANAWEVGLEIEVERIRRHHNPTGYPVWSTRADGSLREDGVEYVSVPIKGTRIHYALNQFYDQLDSGYNFSPRTSIHVHVNVLDMFPHQLGGLLMIASIFEPLFFRFVGGDRERNNFCVPLNDVVTSNTLIRQFMNEAYTIASYEANRYLAINLDAIRKFGSLEFRHLGGTDDKVKIAEWINLIFCLKKYAMEHPWEEIKSRIEKLNTDSSYYVMFKSVFGDCSACLDGTSLQKDMEYPVSRVKKLVMDNPFHNLSRAAVTGQDAWYKKLTEAKKEMTAKMYFDMPQVRNVRGPRVRVDVARPARDAEAGARLNAAAGRINRVAPEVLNYGAAAAGQIAEQRMIAELQQQMIRPDRWFNNPDLELRIGDEE